MNDDLTSTRRVQDGLLHLRTAIAPFVAQNMAKLHGERWPYFASRAAGAPATQALDAYGLLKTIIDNWRDVFAPCFDRTIGQRVRNHASNALEGRNATAHLAVPLSDAEALRYLDAMLELARLVKAPDREVAALKALYEAQRGSGGAAPVAPAAAAPPAQAAGLFDTGDLPAGALKPWIQVALPHPDVLANRFREAEFAADLFAVDSGAASEEYSDPQTFFRITFLTEGLSRVLRNALSRLSGGGGDPIVGLQTAFGGGKTHTMLALYHLTRASDLTLLAGLGTWDEVKALAGRWVQPKVAAFVGTAKGTDVPLVLRDGPRVHTLWGYLAWRLAGDAGLALVREAEEARTNPGSELFLEVLRLAGPCVILLDEVVAYARQLPEERFEAFLSFIQSLTEAAKMAPQCLLVGSLPESEAEAGGERGVQALRRLQAVFGRTQSAWLPASGDETYEIIRRRLFQQLDPEGEKARDETVKAFAKLYRDNRAEFPAYAAEPRYAELMRLSYPIHPELFDRLSKDWSTLEKFQRTRGVLRFMANVVGTLWHEQASSPMIMPARVPVANERVRSNLLFPLDPAFAPVLDKEVDGAGSLPAQKETNPSRRITQARAATRAARSVFLCSAPVVGQPNAGLNGQGLRLACAEPGDQLAIFGEALRELSEQSSYLYEEAGRYWYSTQPTLTRLADDRARALEDHRVDEEIQRLLAEDAARKGGFDRVHAVPGDARLIDEAQGLSLVILPPSVSHAGKAISGSTATEAAMDGLLHCRSGQRRRRNLLVYVAADEANLATARNAIRKALAWKEIEADRQIVASLNNAQTENMRANARTSFDGALRAVRTAWSHVLLPIRDPDETGGPPARFEHGLLTARDRSNIATAVFDHLSQSSSVRSVLGAETFWNTIKGLWPTDQDHILIDTLWDWFASYPYMPKLLGRSVLEEAIRLAARPKDLLLPAFVGVAERWDPVSNAYVGLQYGQTPGPFGPDAVIVRADTARRLLEASSPAVSAAPATDRASASIVAVPGADPGPLAAATQTPAALHKTRFQGSVELDPERPIKSFEAVVNAMVYELQRDPKTRVRLSLTISADNADGFSGDDIGVVRDNARNMKFHLDGDGFS